MAKSRNIMAKEFARKRIQNCTLVIEIEAPRRPYVSIDGLLITHKAGDCRVFGVEACHEEIERRRVILELMTDDEREFFDKYCAARDDDDSPCVTSMIYTPKPSRNSMFSFG